MYKCRFCGYESDYIDDFEKDFQNHKGFWCPYCDGFTYYETYKKSEHSFLLFMENKKESNPIKIHNKFHTQVSPLRYPGGKSKIVGYIYEKCNKNHMDNFIEPFAGGSSVGLTLLLSGRIKELYLNDLDFGIYSLFTVIKTCPYVLVDKIKQFKPSTKAYYEARKIIESDYMNQDIIDAAWNLLLVNRLAFSGICKANCMSNPSARWNPENLVKKINKINEYSEHIHVFNQDALDFISEMYWYKNTTMFIDPPYFNKGKELYHCYFNLQQHKELAFLLDNLYKGMPGSDIIISYDLSEYIKELYYYPTIEELNRKYCIAN